MAPRFEKLSLSTMVPEHPALRECELIVSRPAVAAGTVKALRAVESVSQENGLGSHRPSQFLTALAPDKTRLYFMPVVDSNDPDALHVTYAESRFEINLYRIFKALDRLVPKRTREVYAWEVTQERIEIAGVEGKALYITLGTPKQETIKQMSHATLAKRRATQARKKQAATTEPTSI